MVVHVDRLWKYYGPGNFTWGGLAEAETSNHDDAELGSSSSVAMTDDEDLEEYIFEESPESAWVSIGSPLARREDTIDPSCTRPWKKDVLAGPNGLLGGPQIM